MMRGRGGVTSYVGYGALTLILMYVLFLYNATKTNLHTTEEQVAKLKDEKQEILSQLSVAQEHNKRLKFSAEEANSNLERAQDARKQLEATYKQVLEKSNQSEGMLKNKEAELSTLKKECEGIRLELQSKTEDCENKGKHSLEEYKQLKAEKDANENQLKEDKAKLTAQIQQLQLEANQLQEKAAKNAAAPVGAQLPNLQHPAGQPQPQAGNVALPQAPNNIPNFQLNMQQPNANLQADSIVQQPVQQQQQQNIPNAPIQPLVQNNNLLNNNNLINNQVPNVGQPVQNQVNPSNQNNQANPAVVAYKTTQVAGLLKDIVRRSADKVAAAEEMNNRVSPAVPQAPQVNILHAEAQQQQPGPLGEEGDNNEQGGGKNNSENLPDRYGNNAEGQDAEMADGALQADAVKTDPAAVVMAERMVGAGGDNNKLIDNNPPQQPLALQPAEKNFDIPGGDMAQAVQKEEDDDIHDRWPDDDDTR